MLWETTLQMTVRDNEEARKPALTAPSDHELMLVFLLSKHACLHQQKAPVSVKHICSVPVSLQLLGIQMGVHSCLVSWLDSNEH